MRRTPRSRRPAAGTAAAALAVALAAAPARAAQPPDGFADAAERVRPAVLHVRADTAERPAKMLQQLRVRVGLPPVPEGPATERNTGGGVLVRSDGIAWTNHHVVAGAVSVEVEFADGRRLPAEVVATDPRTDFALLRVRADGPLPVAEVGDSDALRVGDWVFAVGHPFDFAFSLSAGVVSARGRHGLDRDEVQDYIQTDLAANPGSSGGPLFDADGRVVGLVTSIFVPGNGPTRSAGVAFAIPSAMAAWVAEDLERLGRVRRLGAGVVLADAEGGGAEVVRVVPGGPADEAGLRPGDVVVAARGERVAGAADLRAVVAATRPGAELGLRTADGRRLRLRVAEREAVEGPELPGAVRCAGMDLVAATPDNARRLGVGLPEDGGVLVARVAAGGPAALAGVRPGDLVRSAPGLPEPPTDPAALARELERRGVAVLGLLRDGTELQAPIFARGGEQPASGRRRRRGRRRDGTGCPH